MKAPWWMRERVVPAGGGDYRVVVEVSRVYVWWLVARMTARRIFGARQ
jgi:hypothetical protein